MLVGTTPPLELPPLTAAQVPFWQVHSVPSGVFSRIGSAAEHEPEGAVETATMLGLPTWPLAAREAKRMAQSRTDAGAARTIALGQPRPRPRATKAGSAARVIGMTFILANLLDLLPYENRA